MTNIIEINDLCVTYDNFTLKNVNLTVPSDMIVGFVGENGAGKTTTLLSILGLHEEMTGQVNVFETDARHLTQAQKEKIASVLDDVYFNDRFTVAQIGKVMSLAYPNWQQSYFEEKLQAENIQLTKAFGTLSKGMKIKVKLYSALACQPTLLLLDEPTSGLDPVSRHDLLTELQAFMESGERSVVFSSHITSDIESIADFVYFIHRGEIVLAEETDKLLHQYGILQLSQAQIDDLGEFPYLYQQTGAYSQQFLVTNRPHWQKEYPDLVCNRSSIDDIMLMIEKGEVK